MKNLIMKLAIGLLALLVNVPLNATEVVPEVRFEVFGHLKAFNLFVDAEVEEYIEIKDQFNAVIFSDRVPSGSSFAKAIDVSILPEGAYTVHVTNDMRTMHQPLTVTEAGLRIIEEERMIYQLPQVNLEKRIISINTGRNPGAKVKILILQNGEILYRDDRRISNYRNYDVSQLNKGSYTVMVETEIETITKTISLH